ncbi:MAG: hypothetical protein US54_C0001G0033 [Candidatus Roizmanbacteria bacterium GW2011_GWA2_37_7]|uniref:Uncharacterized protein n=1 Tax=Candidatus Roizmanbacteria bacterium GW2011_GWA2_37_7 TaxID=1618481 RepID=A0A0G0H6L3_9BACT|nr:MAG: hypothetical protein US54_C0001G0033 [Candidatus Roizmanbacteria bacterium GW2011_GWA2_37_7]
MSKKSKKLIRAEASTLIVVGVLVITGAAILLSSTLNTTSKTTSSYAEATSCPYDSGVPIPLGQTETDASNAENRWPISQHRSDYDGLVDTSNLQSISDEGVLTLTKTDGGPVDGNVRNMMASMFGYKPKRLIAAYDLPSIGGTYVLEVPVDSENRDIKMPGTGYDIGGGYEAMVVFAASDRVTLHIGRHEYFTGTKTCASGQICSGGYWIYVKNICVDQQIQNAYNKAKGAQEAAGADLNPIQLPMVLPGHILGKASGSSVLVGVRDNGPFISIFKPDYWGGVPEKDIIEQEPTPTNSPEPNIPDIPEDALIPDEPDNPTPTPTFTPTPTLKQRLLYYLPVISGNNNVLEAPTPAPSTTFVVTLNINTQTLCSDEVVAIMSQLGIAKPVICTP